MYLMSRGITTRKGEMIFQQFEVIRKSARLAKVDRLELHDSCVDRQFKEIAILNSTCHFFRFDLFARTFIVRFGINF